MALKEIDSEQPKGEPGLFGPQPAIRQVYGDFTSMSCGSISVLLLQMLHPLALVGVWDHPRFREDIFDRLRRTSQLISATTFAIIPDAERLIAKVQEIHQRIGGADKDGTSHQASDPALLAWVHATECSHFMASYLRYKRTVVSAERQEDYFRESAEVARRLGAQDILQTPQEVVDYLEVTRPQLRCDERTREVAEVPPPTRLSGRLSQPVSQAMMYVGTDLLPEWVQEMPGLPLTLLQRNMTCLLVYGVACALRVSVCSGAWHCAMRRAQVG